MRYRGGISWRKKNISLYYELLIFVVVVVFVVAVVVIVVGILKFLTWEVRWNWRRRVWQFKTGWSYESRFVFASSALFGTKLRMQRKNRIHWAKVVQYWTCLIKCLDIPWSNYVAIIRAKFKLPKQLSFQCLVPTKRPHVLK